MLIGTPHHILIKKRIINQSFFIKINNREQVAHPAIASFTIKRTISQSKYLIYYFIIFIMIYLIILSYFPNHFNTINQSKLILINNNNKTCK